jgi:hypothetical protein
MKSFSLCFAVALLFLLNACEYKPHEVYNRKVKEKTPPDVQIISLNLEEDSIFVNYSGYTVRFVFQTDDRKIAGVVFNIDGQEQGYVESASGEFNLACWNLPVGIHELRMDVYTSAGTGSLADEVGMEGYVVSRTWKLVVFEYVSHPVHWIQDGLLHIRWDPYKGTNFREYVIKRYSGTGNICEIAHLSENEYTDYSYAGERATFTIAVRTDNDYEMSDQDVYMEKQLPELSFFADTLNHYMVKWSRGKYFQGIDSVIIFSSPDYYTYPGTRIGSFDPGKDSLCVIPGARFAEFRNIHIRVVPQKTNVGFGPDWFMDYENSLTGYLGYVFKTFDYTTRYFKAHGNEFLYTDGFHFSRYSIPQKKVTGQMDFSSYNFHGEPVFSGSGKYFATYLENGKKVLYTSTDDLDHYLIRDISQDLGRNAMALADDGTVVMPDYSVGGFRIYNLLTSVSSGIYYRNTYCENVRISADSKYFLFVNDSIHMIRINGPDSFEELWKLKLSPHIFEFDPSDPEKLIVYDGTTMFVLASADHSVIHQFSVNDARILDVDFARGNFLTYSPGHLYVKSLSDGTVKVDVPCSQNSDISYDKYLLIDHTIVSSRGLMYFIRQDI